MTQSSRISTVIKQAKQTFSALLARGDASSSSNYNDIDALARLMNKITKHDLNFTLFDSPIDGHSNTITQNNARKFANSKAPVFYMKLYEDSTISAGIFIIKRHHRIPLHDHPHMFGLIKVFDGHGHLNAYNTLFEHDEQIICSKHTSTPVSAQSDTAVLYPNESNIHEIYAINNDHCAFLDILSPPYSNENDCTCYSVESSTTSNENDQRYILRRIFDDEYYTESLQYTGPPISV